MTSKKIKFPDLVVVTWEDAWSTDGWMSKEGAEEEAENKANVVTTGYIVKRDKERLALAQGVALHKGEIGYSGIFVIPAGMVKSVKKVK